MNRLMFVIGAKCVHGEAGILFLFVVWMNIRIRGTCTRNADRRRLGRRASLPAASQCNIGWNWKLNGKEIEM